MEGESRERIFEASFSASELYSNSFFFFSLSPLKLALSISFSMKSFREEDFLGVIPEWGEFL